MLSIILHSSSMRHRNDGHVVQLLPELPATPLSNCTLTHKYGEIFFIELAISIFGMKCEVEKKKKVFERLNLNLLRFVSFFSFCMLYDAN